MWGQLGLYSRPKLFPSSRKAAPLSTEASTRTSSREAPFSQGILNHLFVAKGSILIVLEGKGVLSGGPY